MMRTEFTFAASDHYGGAYYGSEDAPHAPLHSRQDSHIHGVCLQVQKNEVPQVAAAIQELNEDDADRIPIVYMVVQKMHHTRFFPIDGNKDRSGNCLPGARSCLHCWAAPIGTKGFRALCKQEISCLHDEGGNTCLPRHQHAMHMRCLWGCIVRGCGPVLIAAWKTEGASLVGRPESVFQG